MAMRKTHRYDYTHITYDIGGKHIGEIDCVIHYRVTDEGTPMRYYLRNGDPGYPGDPAEIEVTAITMKIPSSLTNPECEVTTKAWDWLYDYLSTKMENELADELAAHARMEAA